MKRITFILTDPVLKIVGGYKMVYYYANQFAKGEYEVNIIYRIYRTKSNSFVNLLNFIARFFIAKIGPLWFDLNKKIKKRCLRKLEKFDNEEIVVVTAYPTAQEVFLGNLSNVSRTFYFIQDYENWGISNNELEKTYSYGFNNIVNSNWLKEKVNNNSVCIPNGIDTNIYQKKKDVEDRIPFSLAMLYHTQERKRTKDGMQVIFELKKRYPDLHVELYGSPDKPKGLPKWINYTKNATASKVSEILNSVQVFICTSRAEGFGLPGMESMACGCAFVTTPCLGILEYADNEKNAIVLKGFDNSEMIDACSYLFEHSDYRIKLANAAVKDINMRDINYEAHKFYSYIEEVISNNE